MTAPRNDPRADRAAMERELLDRLGLTRDANTQDVETAHDDVVRFLESAPGDLRAWAQREIAAADEAYALLSDPTAEIPAGSMIFAMAPAVAPAVEPAPAPAPARATRVAAPAAAARAVADDEEEEILEDEPVPTRRVRRSGAIRGVATAPEAAARNRLLTRLAVVGAGLVGVAVLVIAVYNFGGGGSGVPGFNGTPAPDTGAAASPAVDQTAVADLMQKLQANPNDIAVLKSLADTYYQGGDYATAGTFFDKILQIDPRNVSALLGRGATAYNVGDATLAEKDWKAVVAIDPKNVDAHYYLGFMYLDSASPDMAKVKAEWQTVIDIAPDSDIAKTIKQHLTSLESAPPASTGASTAPAASSSPAASPSVSAAPAGVQPPAAPSASVAP